MADEFSVIVKGADELVADLGRAQSRALPEVESVVKKGADNIKKDWTQRWSGMAHAPALPRAITYDIYHLPGSIRGQVGPDKDKRQGPLGSIVEFGTVKNAPRPGGLPALETEAPRMEKALSDLTAKLLP